MAESRVDPTWRIGRRILLVLLGLSYVSQYWTLWTQGIGLIGEDGVLPLGPRLDEMRSALGPDCYWRAPSVFWLATSDLFIKSVAGVGIAAGTLLMVGVLPRVSAIVAWVGFVSFTATDGVSGGLLFFNWPFDRLLLEIGFLGFFLAPWGLWPRGERAPQVCPLVRLALVFATFRLFLGSGIIKITVGAPYWHDGSAVGHFLETQPFPSALAPCFVQLPGWILAALTFATLALELVTPLAYFGPRRLRHWAAALGILFMLGVLSMSSFRALNFLSCGMLAILIDDDAWRRWVPSALRRRSSARKTTGARSFVVPRWRRIAFAPVLAVLIVWGLASLCCQAMPGENVVSLASRVSGGRESVARAAQRAHHVLEASRIVSSYSLFGLIAPDRKVVVVQITHDGETWHDLELAAGTTAVDRRPPWFSPFHYSLDFLFWAAAHGTADRAALWLMPLGARLLEGSPAVHGLFRSAPLPAPPIAVRASLFVYEYSSPAERAAGTWWRRRYLGAFAPAVMLENGRLVSFHE